MLLNLSCWTSWSWWRRWLFRCQFLLWLRCNWLQGFLLKSAKNLANFWFVWKVAIARMEIDFNKARSHSLEKSTKYFNSSQCFEVVLYFFFKTETILLHIFKTVISFHDAFLWFPCYFFSTFLQKYMFKIKWRNSLYILTLSRILNVRFSKAEMLFFRLSFNNKF